MKSRKKILAFVLIISLALLIFFLKFYYKKIETGNNMINKSAEIIKENILNIEGYNAVATVTVQSNKNTNTYRILQEANKKTNTFKQELLEPEYIAGTKFEFDGNNLTIENSKLNLKHIYENYKYIESNELSLIAFIEDYKNDETAKIFEKDETVIMETNTKNKNRYSSSKILYINKKTGKIDKMEIIDSTQNTKIYIIYNEIELKNTSKKW